MSGVVTSNEQFDKILAEAQKKEEMDLRRKKKRNEERKRKKMEKIKQGKVSTKRIRKQSLMEANHQQKKKLTITVSNTKIQKTAIQKRMKMYTKMSTGR